MRRAPLLLALALFAGNARAHTPSRAEAFSAGLTPTDAGALGVIALRSAPSGRVWLAGNTFSMGSDLEDLAFATELCAREPWGQLRDAEELSLCDRRRLATELGVHDVTLSGFSIDRTEVTVAAYDRCVGSGVCNPAGFRRGDPRFDRPDFPVTMVTWTEASDYCRWAGGTLPTEAQWEFAARGIEARRFPWGNVYNAHLANHGSLADDPTDATDGYSWLAPVGSFPDGATPTGIDDLAGNVEEWVQDRMDIDLRAYQSQGVRMPLPYLTTPVTNPIATQGLGHRVRGGSFMRGAHQLRANARFAVLDDPRSEDTGFRCVYGAPTPIESSNTHQTITPPKRTD